MAFAQDVMHEMLIQKGETPLCIREGAATDWKPHFCWLPTRMFNVFDGYGKRVWLRTVDRRFCKTADWLTPFPAYWAEYRPTETPP